ncbi:MAG TPA: STAS domain-containing protein [Solirubrobacteraceae bacterium]|nr:STAS domain-containing protein [Solirubrobacteraceae bacterium]
MVGPLAQFEIHESRQDRAVRLRLTGELDLASAPALEQRLEALRADGHNVRLDLSALDFIDSTGVHVLFRAYSFASANGWAFEIDPNVSRPVMRVLEIVNLEHVIPRGDPTPEPTAPLHETAL